MEGKEFSGYMPRKEITGSYGSFIFWEISKLFSIMAILIFTPIDSELKFLFLHILPSIYRHMLVISILTVVKW